MTIAINPDVLTKFEAASLYTGAHDDDSGLGCAMEWASALAGESWSDNPKCVCPTIAAPARRANDCMPADLRDELMKPIVIKALGTAGTAETRAKRAYLAADWAVRWAAPRALRARGREDLAMRLERLTPLTDAATSRAARDESRSVRAAAGAYAAHVADADAAAYGAYAGAAYTAAAAYAAAAAAAYAARREVWVSLCDLLMRMCEVVA